MRQQGMKRKRGRISLSTPQRNWLSYRTASFFVSLILTIGTFIICPAAQGKTTIAVLNFANRATGAEQQKYRWLEKGLADLLITDLASREEFRVVTREHMQMLLEEREIVNTLDLPGNVKESIGRSLRVDCLVFGTFAVKKGKLTLEARITRADTGKVVARSSKRGTIAQVLTMEKSLAGDLIIYLKGGRVKEGIAPRLPQWTDSVPAARYLYEGIDCFDQGLYTKAWYYFRKAVVNDPGFADAHYWLARMSYYRQEYGHARVEYQRFVKNFPTHPRIGDAIMEFVHSYERTTDDPNSLLTLYRTLRERPWPGNRAYHQADYTNWSPLSDWLSKREHQVLVFQEKFSEAFSLLLAGIKDSVPVYKHDRRFRLKAWQNESIRLMAYDAVESEDRFNRRLSSPYLPYQDVVLSPDNPRTGEDIDRKQGLWGGIYKWGRNYRILAPEGYYIKKVTATVKRTNDPQYDSICRLQIRRYRYVDIDCVWTTNKTRPKDLKRTITMPPGCTWFYLRPEYDSSGYDNRGRRVKKDIKSSFDGWRLEAELEPLGPIGRIDLKVVNLSRHKTLVDGIYARCSDGIITNLTPGKHKIEVKHIWPGSAYQAQEREIEIKAGQVIPLVLSLPLSPKVKKEGWQDPVGVSSQYPWFKHRPKRATNLTGSRPTLCRARSGVSIVVWAYLDDLWMATGRDGINWQGPVNIPSPVNSAHVEMSPRLIQDEQGKYCLTFLSDRGVLRNFSTYASWSTDLVHWSRPVMVTSTYHIDHDFIQALDGRYLIVASERVNGRKSVINLRVSKDLRQWSEPVVIPGPRTPRRLCIRQDRYGIFYLVWAEANAEVWYSSSGDLVNWSSPVKLPHRRKYRSSRGLTMQVVKDRLIVGIGNPDQMYSGREVTEFAWRPIGLGKAGWQSLSMPSHVVDAFFDFAYDAASQNILFVWQTTDMSLNTVLPSGPVFAMTGRPKGWFTTKTGVLP